MTWWGTALHKSALLGLSKQIAQRQYGKWGLWWG
jgi:hypothetical protein